MDPRWRVVTKLFLVLVIVPLAALRSGAQGGDFEHAAIMQFQRSADSYAFAHRSSERRGAAPPRAVEGAFFTPELSAVFRNRIKTALKQAGCDPPARPGFEAPSVNASTEGTHLLPPCILTALPRLPPELEYRVAGIALVLADAHLQIVIDVLHAAFP